MFNVLYSTKLSQIVSLINTHILIVEMSDVTTSYGGSLARLSLLEISMFDTLFFIKLS